MKCEICQRTANLDGVTLHRVNPTGVAGIWRCEDHLTAGQRADIDPEVAVITRMIDESNRGGQ